MLGSDFLTEALLVNMKALFFGRDFARDCGHGQRDCESGAFAFNAAHNDAASMFGDDAFGNAALSTQSCRSRTNLDGEITALQLAFHATLCNDCALRRSWRCCLCGCICMPLFGHATMLSAVGATLYCRIIKKSFVSTFVHSQLFITAQ